MTEIFVCLYGVFCGLTQSLFHNNNNNNNSAVILQRDRMVRTGGDIRRLIERRLSLWKDGNYDALMQEAGRCDRALRSSRGRTLKDADIVRVFRHSLNATRQGTCCCPLGHRTCHWSCSVTFNSHQC